MGGKRVFEETNEQEDSHGGSTRAMPPPSVSPNAPTPSGVKTSSQNIWQTRKKKRRNPSPVESQTATLPGEEQRQGQGEKRRATPGTDASSIVLDAWAKNGQHAVASTVAPVGSDPAPHPSTQTTRKFLNIFQQVLLLISVCQATRRRASRFSSDRSNQFGCFSVAANNANSLPLFRLDYNVDM